MNQTQKDIESLFGVSLEIPIFKQYGVDDEATILELLSTQYTFFKLDDAGCDIEAAMSAVPTSEEFLRAGQQGHQGIAAAVTDLAPAYWSWNKSENLSGRTKDIANGLACHHKVLLSPFTGELAYTDVSLGKEWYLHRSQEHYCLVSQLSELAWHANQETVWIFPKFMTVFYVTNGFAFDGIKRFIAQALRRCLQKHPGLRVYMSKASRTVALTDFWCPHLGHYLWNLMSGWSNAFATISPSAFDRLYVHANQAFFGPLKEIFPDEVKTQRIDFVRNDDEIFDLMLWQNALLFSVKDCNFTNDLTQRIIARAYSACSPEFLSMAKRLRAEASPLLLLTIRLENRSWVDQEDGWVALFRRLKLDFPKIGLVIHGMSTDTVKGWTTKWMSLEDEEKAASAIEVQLSRDMPVINSVGGKLAESIVLSDLVDAFVAPIGAGMTLYKWITNKPGVAFSNRSVLDEKSPDRWTFRVYDHFRPRIIETRYLAKDCVQDIEGARHGTITRSNFRMDWRDLHALTDTMLSELFPDARIAAPDAQGPHSCMD